MSQKFTERYKSLQYPKGSTPLHLHPIRFGISITENHLRFIRPPEINFYLYRM